MRRLLRHEWVELIKIAVAAVCTAGLLALAFGLGGGRRQSGLARELEAGELAFQEQRFGDSARSFALATKTDPRSTTAWSLLGGAHLALSDYSRAIEDYDHALGLDPNCVNALLGRGMTHWLRGDLHAAESDYRRLIQVEPNRFLFYHQLERVLMEEHKWAAVASLWEEAMATHPGSPNWRARSLIVQALYEAKDWDRLLQHSRQGIDEAPSEAEAALYRYYRGIALNRLGRPRDALEELERVLRTRPESWTPNAYMRLFEELVYAASSVGDTGRAEQYRQFFEANDKERP